MLCGCVDSESLVQPGAACPPGQTVISEHDANGEADPSQDGFDIHTV